MKINHQNMYQPLFWLMSFYGLNLSTNWKGVYTMVTIPLKKWCCCWSSVTPCGDDLGPCGASWRHLPFRGYLYNETWGQHNCLLQKYALPMYINSQKEYFCFCMVSECPSEGVLWEILHKEENIVEELCVIMITVWWMTASQCFAALPQPVSGVLWLPRFTWSLEFTNLL